MAERLQLPFTNRLPTRQVAVVVLVEPLECHPHLEARGCSDQRAQPRLVRESEAVRIDDQDLAGLAHPVRELQEIRVHQRLAADQTDLGTAVLREEGLELRASELVEVRVPIRLGQTVRAVLIAGVRHQEIRILPGCRLLLEWKQVMIPVVQVQVLHSVPRQQNLAIPVLRAVLAKNRVPIRSEPNLGRAILQALLADRDGCPTVRSRRFSCPIRILVSHVFRPPLSRSTAESRSIRRRPV